MSALPDPMLELKGIKLSFGSKVILRDINLSVKAGEILVIMGSSGTGKSTLLRLVLGLLKPDTGSVLLHGDDIPKLTRPELNRIRRKVGMVYQNAALVSSMTVSDNIGLPLRELSDKKEDEIRSIIDKKLELVGLKDIQDKLPDELSGGMAKRVGLARALALDPELILFDEPSAGLDPINSALIDKLILSLKKEHHVTSIVVTHEMTSAFSIATRMAMLNEGQVLKEGAPEEFKTSGDPFIKEFLSPYLANES